MKPIKLNYRHSLDSMNDQLDRHDELIVPRWYYGRETYKIIDCLHTWGRGLHCEKVLFACNTKSELADYINKKNGFE